MGLRRTESGDLATRSRGKSALRGQLSVSASAPGTGSNAAAVIVVVPIPAGSYQRTFGPEG